ncbi:MAG: hypothetical protein ACKVY0_14090 [Prosthecobacter sp.]|uniref:hypothetical protein n=1 Tax=Prosthecobacter sp. TaxID=1965333 RepID=UPI003903DEFF
MADLEQYHLQWRGIKKGPWNLAAITAALKSGDIHSMHQIEIDGQWQPLRDFLEARQTREKEASRSAGPPVSAAMPDEQTPNGEKLRMPPPVPLRAQQHPGKLTKWSPLLPDRAQKQSRRTTMRPLPFPGQNHAHDVTSQPSEELSPEPPPVFGSDHMEWKHVGTALLFLLGIVAAGFGSYAIIQAVSAPAVEAKRVMHSHR